MDIRFTVFRIFAATIFTEHEKDTSCCSAVLFYTDLSYDVLLLAASVLDKERIPAATGQILRLRLRVHTAAAERLEVE